MGVTNKNEFKGRIKIFLLRKLFNVYTCFCIFYPDNENKRYPIPQTSSKSSLSLNAAMNGALDELAQTLFLYSEEEYNEDSSIIKKETFYTSHMEAISLHTLKADCFEKVNFENYKSESNLSEVIQSLKQAQYMPCFREVHVFTDKACVVQILVPGLEKYNLVRLGIQVPVHGNWENESN